MEGETFLIWNVQGASILNICALCLCHHYMFKEVCSHVTPVLHVYKDQHFSLEYQRVPPKL
jgi:hypothetical protein